MKYFLFIILLICLGDCADDVDSRSGSDYGSVGQLKNYGGIYSPRYDDESYFEYAQTNKQNNDQDNDKDPKKYVVPVNGQMNYGPGGQNGYGPGGQFFGQAGAFLSNGRFQGNGVGIAGGLGLSAGLDVAAGLGAGLVGNLGGNIGIGINANLQVNLDASINLNNREDIVRPCNLDDWQCVRKFFSSNSQCSPSYGPVPDPLYFAQSTLYIPFINLNALLTNVKITGLGSAKIRDFYVNRVTGNLVLTIDIQNLNETSPRSYMKYHRRGKESVILADISAFAFAQLSLTVVIPRLPNLRLDLAEVHVDFDDNESPKYDFGPGIVNSTNSLVVAANAKLSANLQAVIKESFLFQAQLLAAIYIQQNICDFGLKLSST